ncbi:MAG: signal peptidase II [Planctomycetota bacterium]|jgi:signal peptidase II
MAAAGDATGGRGSLRAWRCPGSWALLLTVLTVGLALDLGTKAWAFRTIAGRPVQLERERFLADPLHNPIPFHRGSSALPWNLLDFRLVVNRGAVFGIGADQRFLFIVFTCLALAAGVAIFALRTRGRHRLAHLSLALILAGGLGNLFDRISFGVVRDFLHMLPRRHLPFGWSWPGGSSEIFPWVFNVADTMLLAGMVLLMFHINRVEKMRHRRQQAAEAAPSAATPPPSPAPAPAE